MRTGIKFRAHLLALLMLFGVCAPTLMRAECLCTGKVLISTERFMDCTPLSESDGPCFIPLCCDVDELGLEPEMTFERSFQFNAPAQPEIAMTHEVVLALTEDDLFLSIDMRGPPFLSVSQFLSKHCVYRI